MLMFFAVLSGVYSFLFLCLLGLTILLMEPNDNSQISGVSWLLFIVSVSYLITFWLGGFNV